MTQVSPYLGVDLGAESGRVMLGKFDGRTIGLEEVTRFRTTGTSIAESLRWDVLGFWHQIQDGLAQAQVEAIDHGLGPIRSVGVDTWGVDYVLMDGNEVLGFPWHYRDLRNRAAFEMALREVPAEEIYRATGIQLMEINTVFQLVAAQRSGDLLERADRLLLIPDFFHWCLCGAESVEFTNATTSQCLDPLTRDWARPLLERLGIPLNPFGSLVEPGTVLGTLRPSVADRTGLGSLPVTAPGTHDTASAVAAIPVEPQYGSNWAYISSGTWSLVGIESDRPIFNDDARALNITNEGGVEGTWRLLKNVIGLWLIQGLRASAARDGSVYDYPELIRMAETSVPHRTLIDPDLPALLNPSDMREAISTACQHFGEPVPETIGDAVRCALESLALRYAQVFEALQRLTGRNLSVIHVVGGGCQNDLLNQFIADACGLPVVAGPVEATALGNVLMQAKGQGQIGSLTELREIVRNSVAPRHFEPHDTTGWSEARERFAKLCQVTRHRL